jgi:hypothetical protein
MSPVFVAGAGDVDCARLWALAPVPAPGDISGSAGFVGEGASGCPRLAPAVVCDAGNSAGFELFCVGKLAAMTTNRMAAAPPRTPGNQFFECSQSRRGLHRGILNSCHIRETVAATMPKSLKDGIPGAPAGLERLTAGWQTQRLRAIDQLRSCHCSRSKFSERQA